MVNNMLWLKLLVINLVIVNSDAYRILAVFPIPSASDQRIFNKVTSALSDHGHEVVVITPNAKEYDNSENISVIDVQDETKEVLSKNNKEINMDKTPTEIYEIFKTHLQSRKVQDLINNDEKFDLLLLDAHFPISLGFTEVFDLPVVVINLKPKTGTKTDQTFGAINHPVLYERVSKQNSIWKILPTLVSSGSTFLFQNQEVEKNSKKVLKDLFGIHTLPLEVLYEKVDLVMFNQNTVLESNRPMYTGLININSIGMKSYETIEEYLETYLDSAENGIILCNIEMENMTKKQKDTFLEIVSNLPYDFLLKWSLDEMENKPKNVYLYKMIPEAAVLEHQNVKSFIGRGSSEAISKALAAGKPVIVIPLTAEDEANADLIVRHDVGIKLGAELQRYLVEDAIGTVMMNERLRNNAIRMGKILNDHPKTIEEHAAWWTGYVVRHQGTSHLRSPTSNITWSTYLVLDVMGIVLGIVLGILVILGMILKVVVIKLRPVKRKHSKYENSWTILPTHSYKAHL